MLLTKNPWHLGVTAHSLASAGEQAREPSCFVFENLDQSVRHIWLSYLPVSRRESSTRLTSFAWMRNRPIILLRVLSKWRALQLLQTCRTSSSPRAASRITSGRSPRHNSYLIRRLLLVLVQRWGFGPSTPRMLSLSMQFRHNWSKDHWNSECSMSLAGRSV